MLDSDYTIYDPSLQEPTRGREFVRKLNEEFLKAIPDMKFRILNVMAKGDTVAAEAIMYGTFKGPVEFMGRTIPPTGGHVELQLVTIWRVNSKSLLAEARNYSYGMAGLLQQLGKKA
jgi:predicted ester cyclase